MFGDPVTNPKNWDIEKLKSKFAIENIKILLYNICMANFDFLLYEKDFSAFSEHAINAEKEYNRNLYFCGFACRKTVEQAVKWMYSVDGDLRLPYNDNIQSLVHEQTFKQIVPKSIRDDIQCVIRSGNEAVHDIFTNKAFALLALKALFNFISWIDYTYGSDYKQRQFDETLIPTYTAKIIIKKPKKEEIINYKEELESKDQTIAELKKQLEEQAKLIAARKTDSKPKPKLKTEDLSEFQTRKLFIDEDLKLLGWKIDQVQVVEEYFVNDLENIQGKTGRIDYVLFGKDGNPLAVIEAKKTTKDANIGKQQAVLYADCMERKFGRRPFIFYTNGFETYFWDDTKYPPRPVSMIFNQNDLQKLYDRKNLLSNLDDIKINLDITGRPYQQGAIRAITDELQKNERKFLVVMATGTGKTRTAISIVDVLSRGNYITNVLFLADRIQLVEQAYNAFREHCPSISICNLLDAKSKQQNKNARIVFSTYPTILNAIDSEKTNDGERLYTPAHFDLIIVDEAHRSIFNKYRAIFDYFDSYLIGLTATPRKDVDRSTYEFFEVQDDIPTYVYEYEAAIENNYLVPYRTIEKTSIFLDEGITKENLSEKDLEKIRELEENGESPFEDIPSSAINDFVFNEDTTRHVLEDLMQKGIKTSGGDKLGKSIIFAYNKKHAQHIIDVFNKHYPQYKGKMAKRIVCDDEKVDSIIKEFKNPNSELSIAVSVDMLDTGVDIPEVVNLVFYKKIRSKIKFWQMIGRGTRLSQELECIDETGAYIGKKYFYIFDYLRNFEFFRENKNGIEGNSSKSLSERIFSNKCSVIKLLQTAEYAKENYLTFRNKLVNEVYNQISSLNENLTPVRLVRKYVTKFKNIKTFECLTEEDVYELSKFIAPLVYNEEIDQYAKSFDNFCYGIMNDKLSEESINFYRTKIKSIAEILIDKATIQAVRDKLQIIHNLIVEPYYETCSVLDFEVIRQEIRNLVQFSVDRRTKKDIFIDFEDSIKTVDPPENSEPIQITFDEYKKKVDFYLQEHLADEAINKLRTNQPLTKDDYNRLDSIFTKELGNKELFNQYCAGKSLGVFIRSITKMDRNSVNNFFAEFINDSSLNIRQIQFVEHIINLIIEHGEINLESLIQGKAPFDRPKLLSIFGKDAQVKLFAVIKSFNDNAKFA